MTVADLTFYLGDTAPSIFGTLTDPTTGQPFDLTDSTVRFQMRLATDGRYSVDAVAVVVDEDTGDVRYDWAAGDLSTPGDFVSHWQITYLDNTVQHTVPGNSITVGLS